MAADENTRSLKKGKAFYCITSVIGDTRVRELPI